MNKKHMEVLKQIANLSITKVVASAPKQERMSFTIGDHIECEYGSYMTVAVVECACCQIPFPTILSEDPGSVEAAIGVSYVCDHPGCLEIAGNSVLISGTDIYELLNMDFDEIAKLAEINPMFVCEEIEPIDLDAILMRRQEAGEYLQSLDDSWDDDQYSYWDTFEEDTRDEHWKNYWSDYNQCGIHISR